MAKASMRVAGRELALPPDLFSAEKIEVRHYWVGIVPGSPIVQVHLGGVCFRQETAFLAPNDETGESAIHVPRRGGIELLTYDGFLRMTAAIRRTVIRPVRRLRKRASTISPASIEEKEEIPAEDYESTRGMIGHIFRLPRDGERSSYAPRKGDVGVSTMIYAVPADIVEGRPVVGHIIPSPVSEAGIEWCGPTPALVAASA